MGDKVRDAAIIDEATPYLTKLAEISDGATKEALGKVGNVLRLAMIDRARAYGAVRNSAAIFGGRRRLTREKKSAFSRISHDDGSELDTSMAELIRFRVYATNKLIVGWANMKGWAPDKYVNGVKVGKMPRVKGVGNGFQEIGRKLEYGGSAALSEKQKRLFKASGWGKAAKRGSVNFKRRPVISPVFHAHRGGIVSDFERAYFQILRSLR